MKTLKLTILLIVTVAVTVSAQTKRPSAQEIKKEAKCDIEEYGKKINQYCLQIQNSQSKKETRKYARKIMQITNSLKGNLIESYGMIAFEDKYTPVYGNKFIGFTKTPQMYYYVPSISAYLDRINNITTDIVLFPGMKKALQRKIQKINNTLSELDS